MHKRVNYGFSIFLALFSTIYRSFFHPYLNQFWHCFNFFLYYVLHTSQNFEIVLISCSMFSSNATILSFPFLFATLQCLHQNCKIFPFFNSWTFLAYGILASVTNIHFRFIHKEQNFSSFIIISPQPILSVELLLIVFVTLFFCD